MTQPVDQAAQRRIARAHGACDCDRAYGIAYACPATLLPRMGERLIVRGPTMTIPHAMPLSFECPRYIIMGW